MSPHTCTLTSIQQHNRSIPDGRGGARLTTCNQNHSLVFFFRIVLKDCFLHRTMIPGPSEPSLFWGPNRDTTSHRRKDPRWLRRLQQQRPVRDRMSRSPEESHSRGGGSDCDLKMASCNTSPEGGPPPPLHQNRIRQVGVCPHPAPCIEWPSRSRSPKRRWGWTVKSGLVCSDVSLTCAPVSC